MKNLLRFVIFSSLVTILLGSCAFLPAVEPKSDYTMQTEIVQILTAMATGAVDQPTVDLPTPTPGVTASPEEPTAEVYQPEVTVEIALPTAEIGQLATSTPFEGFINTPAPLPADLQPTGTLAATLASTNLPAASPTTMPGDPAQSLGTPSLVDTFDSGDNWPLGVDKYVDMKASGGALHMTGLIMQNGWRLSNQKALNFYLEVSGKMTTCSGADHFGIIFRVPNATLADRGYLYGISCDGKFALRKWDVDTMTVIHNWKAESAILTGSNQPNRLGVMVNGSEIKLYINGKHVDTIQDTSFGQGYYGLYIGPKVTQKLTAVYDELAFWLLP